MITWATFTFPPLNLWNICPHYSTWWDSKYYIGEENIGGKGQWKLNWKPQKNKGDVMSGGMESMFEDELEEMKQDCCSFENPCSSEQVVMDIRNRALFGLTKHGILLDKNTREDMLNHLYEELLDAAVYIRTLIEQRKKNDY